MDRGTCSLQTFVPQVFRSQVPLSLYEEQSQELILRSFDCSLGGGFPSCHPFNESGFALASDHCLWPMLYSSPTDLSSPPRGFILQPLGLRGQVCVRGAAPPEPPAIRLASKPRVVPGQQAVLLCCTRLSSVVPHLSHTRGLVPRPLVWSIWGPTDDKRGGKPRPRLRRLASQWGLLGVAICWKKILVKRGHFKSIESKNHLINLSKWQSFENSFTC